jgi:hypothetical protein
MAINQLQNQYGGQQQQQVQNILNQGYEDFQNQRKYPYQQLEFMSGLMRGTPMGTVSSMYQAPGSMLGQAAGLGMGAYGLSQMGMKFADGGAVGYAGGGGVDSPDNVAAIVGKLTDEQLAQAEQAAKARGDVEQFRRDGTGGLDAAHGVVVAGEAVVDEEAAVEESPSQTNRWCNARRDGCDETTRSRRRGCARRERRK